MGSKVLMGMVTFGNLNFTKLAVQSIKDTTTTPVDFFLVVGKPGDVQTVEWLQTRPEIKYKVHESNKGFPYSINDIYDFAWIQNDYDYLILCGNDIVAYPNTVDDLIRVADTSDYEVVSSNQYGVKELTRDFPQTKRYFGGSNYIFSDFSSEPWKLFQPSTDDIQIDDMQLYDIQNLCLYKKSVFSKVGYTDVSFYPAYFVDNDYARRIVKAGIIGCSLKNRKFFHFWSRTIHQETGGSNHDYFKNNERYYKTKWGGGFGHERLDAPIKISDRVLEEQIINSWRKTKI